MLTVSSAGELVRQVEWCHLRSRMVMRSPLRIAALHVRQWPAAGAVVRRVVGIGSGSPFACVCCVGLLP